MNTFSEMNGIDLFERTLQVQSVSNNTTKMQKFIKRELRKIEGVTFYTRKGNIYATKGEADTYPCMVSHTDTVHEIVSGYQVYVAGKQYFALKNGKKPTGVGGDDKVGIFICLQALIEMDVCKAAFFRDEEIGCIGSSEADMDFFKDVGFALQCDRKGNSDFVTDIWGQISSEEFQDDIYDIVSSHGYKFSDGGLTDVRQLADNGIGVSVANMSCGYYNPHTKDEFIDVDDVENCLNMCLAILKEHGNKRYEYTYREKTYYSSYSSRYGTEDYWDSWGRPHYKKTEDEKVTNRAPRGRGYTAADIVDSIEEYYEFYEHDCEHCGSHHTKFDWFRFPQVGMVCMECSTQMDVTAGDMFDIGLSFGVDYTLIDGELVILQEYAY